MFHIVFDSRGAELITAAMDLDEALDGETILIQDDYSVGPIQDLFSEDGPARSQEMVGCRSVRKINPLEI